MNKTTNLTLLEERRKKVNIKINEIANVLIEYFPKIKINNEEIEIDWSDAFIAGGAIRDLLLEEQPKDYDLWFISSKNHFILYELAKNLEKPIVLWSSNQTYNFTLSRSVLGNINIDAAYNNKLIKFQIILLEYGPPEKIVQQFDFVNNTHFFKFTDENCSFNNLISGIDKELFPNFYAQDTFTQIGRLIYFIRKGFDISPLSFQQLAKNLENQQKRIGISFDQMPSFKTSNFDSKSSVSVLSSSTTDTNTITPTLRLIDDSEIPF